jgi:hypothetical protein
VRAVCMRSAGSPDAPRVNAALIALAEAERVPRDAVEARSAERTPETHAQLSEIANLALVAASDLASSMTGVIANGTCGDRLTSGDAARGVGCGVVTVQPDDMRQRAPVRSPPRSRFRCLFPGMAGAVKSSVVTALAAPGCVGRSVHRLAYWKDGS